MSLSKNDQLILEQREQDVENLKRKFPEFFQSLTNVARTITARLSLNKKKYVRQGIKYPEALSIVPEYRGVVHFYLNSSEFHSILVNSLTEKEKETTLILLDNVITIPNENPLEGLSLEVYNSFEPPRSFCQKLFKF